MRKYSPSGREQSSCKTWNFSSNAPIQHKCGRDSDCRRVMLKNLCVRKQTRKQEYYIFAISRFCPCICKLLWIFSLFHSVFFAIWINALDSILVHFSWPHFGISGKVGNIFFVVVVDEQECEQKRSWSCSNQVSIIFNWGN